MNTNLTSNLMAFETMHGLADLGRKSVCQSGSMADYATYSTLNLNITHIPVQLISGLCLPKECTPDQLESFSGMITSKANALLMNIQKNHHLIPIHEDSGLIRDFTRLQIAVNPSSYYTEEWKDDVNLGYIISLVFCSVLFALFCVVPNAFVVWRHCRQKETTPNDKLGWRLQQSAFLKKQRKLEAQKEE